MAETLTIARPDDWHVHLRDGDGMKTAVQATARQFARAIVMPNLKPPVVDVAAARAYRARIVGGAAERRAVRAADDAVSHGEHAARGDREGRQAIGAIAAVKYYPAGATTNSASGVTDIRRCDAVLEAMQAAGMPLLVHGEVTDPEVDVFDREAVFVDRILAPLVKRFPKLKIVVEHITTHEAAAFVERAPDNVGATITAHHLLITATRSSRAASSRITIACRCSSASRTAGRW